MDIPVSRLNNRMALHTPAEFPLGLVFVVGKVKNRMRPVEGSEEVTFSLVERGYHLRCTLPERSAQTMFDDGDTVRATGHLVFDPTRVGYFLQARDIERIHEPKEAPEQKRSASILADIDRSAQSSSLPQAALPAWVKELAPPEIQGQLGLGESDADSTHQTATEAGSSTTMPTEQGGDDEQHPLPDGLTSDLATFLSQAIDSEEDVEVTSSLIAKLGPANPRGNGSFKVAYPYDLSTPKPAPPDYTNRVMAAIVILLLVVFLFVFSYLIITAL